MAIRRPLDTNVVDITGADLASDIAISTTGNIATTGSGTLTVAGASNFGSVASGTLGSSVVLPAGTILQVQGTQITATDIAKTDNFGNGSAGTGTFHAISVFEVTVSPKQTGSSFHIMFTVSLGATGSAEGMILLKRGYDSSGGTSFTYTDIKGNASGSATQTTMAFDYDWGYGDNDVVTRSCSIWDSSPSYVAGGKFKYTLYWNNKHNQDNDLYLNKPATVGGHENSTATSSIVVYEIAG